MSSDSPFRPRATRMQRLGDRAAADAAAAGGKAIDLAGAQIAAQFGPAREYNDLKRRVEITLRRGAGDVETRIRYKVLADRLLPPDCLASALLMVRRAIWKEREADRRHRRACGLPLPGSRATLDRLREAHLIMRWLRAKGLAEIWPQVLECLEGDPLGRRPSLFVVMGGRGYEIGGAA